MFIIISIGFDYIAHRVGSTQATGKHLMAGDPCYYFLDQFCLDPYHMGLLYLNLSNNDLYCWELFSSDPFQSNLFHLVFSHPSYCFKPPADSRVPTDQKLSFTTSGSICQSEREPPHLVPSWLVAQRLVIPWPKLIKTLL